MTDSRVSSPVEEPDSTASLPAAVDCTECRLSTAAGRSAGDKSECSGCDVNLGGSEQSSRHDVDPNGGGEARRAWGTA